MQRALCSFAILAVSFADPAGAEEKKPVVAVFEIQAQNIHLSPTVLSALAGYVASKLAETGRYEVVPQDKLKEALTENKKKTYKDCYSQSCQIAIGQEVAANRALSTKVLKLGTRCTVTSDLFDLRKATSGTSATAKGECSEDGIQSSIDLVVAKLAVSAGAPARGGTSPAKPDAPAPVAKPEPPVARPVPPVAKPDPPAAKPELPAPAPAPRGLVLDGNELRLAAAINFETNKPTLHRQSFALLDELARTLVANPQLRRLRIEGHTDNRGGASWLLELSQARASAVHAYLVRRGVAAARLEAVGYGMTKPIAPNLTAAGRARNRRVTIVVLEGAPAAPSPAPAPLPAATGDARAQFQRGQRAYSEGRYSDALQAFRAAHALQPLPALEFNIARCHEQLGQLAEAIAAYRRFIARSPAGAATDQALERVKQLEARHRSP